ncbi:MAG: RNA-directed DNA polymerase [Candidatus Eisenbacteria bacterium]|nr:RNA-directed DNA polymerase [Candidatus Eisenbacteria bacterium]
MNSDGIVRYLDIKRFYPSITTELAVQVWHRSAERGRLSKHWLELGDKLIADQGQTCGSEEKGVLTGPMLSHLLGNLVLRNLDERFAVHLPAGYFRYVDDITLVGSRSEVTRAVDTVRTELGELGFETHDDESDKSIEVTTTEWLMGRDDYAASGTQVSWKAFIGNLKRWLLIHPDETQQMRSMLRDRGFRVPVLDYSMAVKHRGYLMRLMELARHHWVRLKTMKIKPRTLMHLGDTLRDKYFREFESILRMLDGADRFTRKRMVPKLRYRASRLICLATEDQLRSLAEAALGIPELHHHGRVMEAVATGNVRAALGLGTDTAQAVAQTLVAAGKEAQVGGSALSDLERQSLAVLALNGVVLRGVPHETQAGGELWQFALNGVDRSLMKSEDPFMREVACLHGLSDEPRHSFMLSNAYDEDEVLAMDAVDQLQQSMSE